MKTLNLKQSQLAAGLIFIIVGGLIYSNSLHGSFQYDDEIFIVRNTALRQITDLPAIWGAFNSRFVTGMTFALNYAWGQTSTFGYHFVNLVIHISNAFLVFILGGLLFQTPYFRRQPLERGAENFIPPFFKTAAFGPQMEAGLAPAEGKSKGTPGFSRGGAIPFFAALIFLTHPIQTQAVDYISQRATSLAVLFYLSTLVLYLKARIGGEARYLRWALATTVLAMFTKELAFTLPIMLVVLEKFFFDLTALQLHRRLKDLLPFLLTLFFIPLTLAGDKPGSIMGLGQQLQGGGFVFHNCLTAVCVLVTYLRLLIFPFSQNLDYDYPLVTGVGEARFLWALFVLLVVLGVAIFQFRRWRWLSFCLLWFFLGLSVETIPSVYAGPDLIYEHWLYLSSVGFAFFAAWVLAQVVRQPAVRLVLAAAVVLFFGFLTFERNKVWQTPITLWQDVAKKSPEKSRAFDNLGAEYLQRGDYEQALKNLDIVQAHGDHNVKTLNTRGLIYLGQKDFLRARVAFELALKIDPGFAAGYCNLGVLFLRKDAYVQAQKYFLRALELDPSLIEPRRNLAVICILNGQLPEAAQMFEEALARDPFDVESLHGLAGLYLADGRLLEAERLSMRILKISRDASRLTELGSVFAFHGLSQPAMTLFDRALTLDPRRPEVYLEKGKLYGNLDQFDQAIAIWRQGGILFPADGRFAELIAQAENFKKEIR